jgi:hypothetical protein
MKFAAVTSLPRLATVESTADAKAISAPKGAVVCRTVTVSINRRRIQNELEQELRRVLGLRVDG